MRDWTISSCVLIDCNITNGGHDKTSVRFLVPHSSEGLLIYTMLVCNEGFKRAKSAGEIVNSILLKTQNESCVCVAGRGWGWVGILRNDKCSV